MHQYHGAGNPQPYSPQQYAAQPQQHGQPYPQQGYPQQPQPGYAYGQQPPRPQQPAIGTPATGKALFTACWKMLQQDKQLLWLPIIGFVGAVVAAVALFVPGFFLGDGLGGDDGTRFGVYVGGILGGFAASFVSIYFQAALIIGANMRADGYEPTVGNTLRAAGRLAGKILAWAVVTTTVGAAIRAIEQRFGPIGRILGIVAGIAWAIASYLVLPVIVVEGLGPVAAVKRSSQLLKQTWGTGLRTNVRAGLIQLALMIIPILAIVAGIFLIINTPALGIGLAAVGVIALFAIGLVFGAINGYARTLIYRYATGRPIPLAPELISVAFTAKQPAYAGPTGPSQYYQQR
jgi:hypothetical protein